MRPILAIIPPFPVSYIVPLGAAIFVLALFLVGRNFREAQTLPAAEREISQLLAPLGLALFAIVLMVLWSRSEIKLHSYGLLLIIGFLLATWNACLEAQRRGYDPNIIIDLAVPLLLVSVVLCRLLYVALNREQFHSLADVLRIWDGGLAFHGAIIGAISVVAFFAWKHKIGFWHLADLIAPSVFLGYFFGRLGCFFNGCCYGGACDLPWAMVFPDEFHRGLYTPPSHPAQLYSAAMALPLFFWMQRAKKQPRFNQFAGQLTLLFFGLYAVERFIMELFRNGATSHTVFGISWLTEAQGISIFGLLVVVMFWLALSRAARRDKNVASPNEPVSASTLNAPSHVSPGG